MGCQLLLDVLSCVDQMTLPDAICPICRWRESRHRWSPQPHIHRLVNSQSRGKWVFFSQRKAKNLTEKMPLSLPGSPWREPRTSVHGVGSKCWGHRTSCNSASLECVWEGSQPFCWGGRGRSWQRTTQRSVPPCPFQRALREDSKQGVMAVFPPGMVQQLLPRG